MTTIKDISRDCGVSASTVSRALANNSLISDEVKKRINESAQRLGYVPNNVARNLRSGKTWGIGILSFVDEEMGFSHYLFSKIMDSFVKVMHKHKYDVTLISHVVLRDDADLVGFCKSKGLEGVLVFSGDLKGKQLEKLLASDIPVISVDTADDTLFDKVYCVTSDNYQQMYNVTDYVIKNGHKNFVYLSGEDMYVTRERVKGLKQAVSDNGLEFNDGMIVEANYYNAKDSAKKIKEVLNREDCPTCLMLSDDYVAICAYNIIAERGMSIGNDISVVGFDGLELAYPLRPKLTTVAQDTLKLGQVAANAMIDAINKKDIPRVQVVNSTFIEGSSVKNLNN